MLTNFSLAPLQLAARGFAAHPSNIMLNHPRFFCDHPKDFRAKAAHKNNENWSVAVRGTVMIISTVQCGQLTSPVTMQ